MTAEQKQSREAAGIPIAMPNPMIFAAQRALAYRRKQSAKELRYYLLLFWALVALVAILIPFQAWTAASLSLCVLGANVALLFRAHDREKRLRLEAMAMREKTLRPFSE